MEKVASQQRDVTCISAELIRNLIDSPHLFLPCISYRIGQKVVRLISVGPTLFMYENDSCPILLVAESHPDRLGTISQDDVSEIYLFGDFASCSAFVYRMFPKVTMRVKF